MLGKREILNQVTFFNSLKEFDLKIDDIDKNISLELVEFLFSFPHLENISLDANDFSESVLLLPPPSKIKRLSLNMFRIFLENGVTSFFESGKSFSIDSYVC